MRKSLMRLAEGLRDQFALEYTSQRRASRELVDCSGGHFLIAEATRVEALTEKKNVSSVGMPDNGQTCS